MAATARVAQPSLIQWTRGPVSAACHDSDRSRYMPDQQGNSTADEETVPQTPLHAYKEGREEDVKGDLEKLKSGDPRQMQQRELEDDDEPDIPKR